MEIFWTHKEEVSLEEQHAQNIKDWVREQDQRLVEKGRTLLRATRKGSNIKPRSTIYS